MYHFYLLIFVERWKGALNDSATILMHCGPSKDCLCVIFFSFLIFIYMCRVGIPTLVSFSIVGVCPVARVKKKHG